MALGVTAVALAGSPGLAATDGVLGPRSSGTTVVSISKVDRVRVSGISDIALSSWSAGGPTPSGATGFCVFSSTGHYQVVASSAHSSGANFRLTNGSDFVVYSVQWGSGSKTTPMTSGTPLTHRTGDADDPSCAGRLPAAVVVRAVEAQMGSAPSGRFTDTLTVLVAPE